MTDNEEYHTMDSQPNHQLVLSENCVEYFLFIIDPALEARNRLSQLEILRQTALQLSHSLTKDYIWQRDEFNLELRNENGLTYLYGITDYGDAVEDEWLIVYIIRELSTSNATLWARIADADGEFLLVEAANVLPRWISPEIDRNRVWINNGQLYIIPIDEAAAPKTEPLQLKKAVEFVTAKSAALVHSPFIQEEAFYRLGKYPGQIADSLHHSMVTIPRRLAFVIHSVPKAVSAAVEAFYLRDPISLKPILSASQTLIFPPEDMVTMSVCFSKVLFAQIRSQHFEVPSRWQGLLRETEDANDSAAQTRLETGMKLTCGFEMLAASAHKSKSRIAREMAIVIDDLQEDGNEVLPSDAEIRGWPNSQKEDDDGWMDINYEDFERELGGERATAGEAKSASGFGDAQTQTDLRKIVSRFEAFLNDDKAGLDGAQLDDMDYDNDDDDDDNDDELDEDSGSEDREVGFDEAEFSRMMREMMGFRPEASNAPSAQKRQQPPAELTPADEEEAQEIEEIKNLTSQMESELKEHDALALDPRDGRTLENKDKGKSKASAPTDSTSDDESDQDEVDIDYNLAKNLLESFKSQGGMSGPTGNLLGIMGIQLPRDEDDENGRPSAASSSRPSPN